MAIVTLVLWTITAAAGVSLLGAGGAARRRVAAAAEQDAGRPLTTPARTPAVPLTAEGKPPPVPRVKVATPPGEHPLLEFSHPALALTGLACWFMFVFVRYRPFAWISFGILVVTIAAGLIWLTRNTQAARRHAGGAWSFPPRLAAFHGLAAAVAITLTVLTALSAGRG
ncbi:MAG TPA: hypothetical protein VMI33_00780 [Streptosporangiaceae bacterium]|nr:hypothetical protein [Streptosporangiaceae bacterium]